MIPAEIVERLLVLRGITAERREAFLDPSLKRLLPPESLPGVEAAACVLVPFIRDRKKIVVFGDYDCDGVCASAILVSALRTYGAAVEAFLPNRFTEGYGMTKASLGRLLEEHPDVALVITVDNGITSAQEVAALRSRGIAVVVTDHHLAGTEIPEADALVNPHVVPGPGCENLCGAGVAFFLASALAKCPGLPPANGRFGMKALVLAGLATVVDIVPLTDQNRVLVAQSLIAFTRYAPRGLFELWQRASRSATAVRAWDYGFLLGPRVNAAGRMDTARLAFDLLMATDVETVREFARRIDNLNTERRTTESQMTDEVCEQIVPGASAVVARGGEESSWHSGVAGIVAARVMEKTGCPVAIAVGDHGSVRAPDGYNVHDALTAAAETLDRFGGHAAAGGFSVKPGRFEEFTRLFTEACAGQYAQHGDLIDAAKEPDPDLWIEPEDLTLGLYRELRRFEPYGEGNPEPVFGLRGVHFQEVRPIGLDGRHMSLTFVNRSVPRAVWWGHGAEVESLRAGAAAHDVLFTLVLSVFGGEEHLELNVQAVR